MDTYSGIVKEMGTMAESMVKSSHPESKMIKDRQQVLVRFLFIYMILSNCTLLCLWPGVWYFSLLILGLLETCLFIADSCMYLDISCLYESQDINEKAAAS